MSEIKRVTLGRNGLPAAGGFGSDLGWASNCSLSTNPRYSSLYGFATKTLVGRPSWNSLSTAVKKSREGITLTSPVRISGTFE